MRRFRRRPAIPSQHPRPVLPYYPNVGGDIVDIGPTKPGAPPSEAFVLSTYSAQPVNSNGLIVPFGGTSPNPGVARDIPFNFTVDRGTRVVLRALEVGYVPQILQNTQSYIDAFGVGRGVTSLRLPTWTLSVNGSPQQNMASQTFFDIAIVATKFPCYIVCEENSVVQVNFHWDLMADEGNIDAFFFGCFYGEQLQNTACEKNVEPANKQAVPVVTGELL